MSLNFLPGQTLGPLIPAAALAVSVACILIYRHLSRQRNVPYPPGPPAPNFLLGHFGKLPTKKAWLDYMEMGKTYGEHHCLNRYLHNTKSVSHLLGDMIYFKSLRDHILVLNSAKAANDLLEKQARITSDRPHANPLDE